MDEDEIGQHGTRFWRWLALCAVAIVAGPAVLWLIVTFVRSNVTPPKVVYRPVAMAEVERAAEEVAAPVVASEPSPPPFVVAAATNSSGGIRATTGSIEPPGEQIVVPARIAHVVELAPGERISGPIPLPPRRPKYMLVAAAGNVPVPRARPSVAEAPAEATPVISIARPEYQ